MGKTYKADKLKRKSFFLNIARDNSVEAIPVSSPTEGMAMMNSRGVGVRQQMKRKFINDNL